MKRIIIISLIVLTGISSGHCWGQERYIKLYSGGVEVYSTSTTGNNSLTFPNGTATFTHNGNATTFSLSAIDSMVFVKVTGPIDDDDTTGVDPVEVDTGSAVIITWDGPSVSVINPYSTQGISVTPAGGHVSVVSTIDTEYVNYILRGSCSDGSLTLTTEQKVMLVLDNLTLTSPSSPALWVASDKKAIVNLSGTNNLTDGVASTGKGALQSAGKFAFQGDGVLNVTGNAKHGIQSSGSTTVNSGTIHVLGAVKDGMNVDNFIINDGTVTVTNQNGDGIDGDQGYIQINGGSVTVTCNAADAKGICCDSALTIAGGTVNVTCSGNQSKCLKSGGNMVFTGGNTTLAANGTLVIENYSASYCTGAKVGGNLRFLGGTLTSTCSSSNAGGKAISVDGDVLISGGVLNLTAQGNCAKYNISATTYDSYASACLKANGNITVSGGTITANAGGRSITTDANYTQTGGDITATTNKAGFTVTGTGTSCTDGFAAACLKADSNIVITGGSFHGSSTGTGGRGIVANGRFIVGTLGAEDSLVNIYVTTSGAPVNVSSGGWPGMGGEGDYWKGLPKGIKIQDDIIINSGHVQSYCSQTSGSTTAEAIETKDSLFVYGGTVEANSYDDAINAASFIRITGGQVWAYARGNDGLDCNGNRIEVSGGTVICRGTEVAIDDNGDHGGKLYVTGGTIILVGGSMGTTEATPQVTGQKSVQITSNTSTLLSNGFAIKNETSNDVIVTFKWSSFTGSGFETYMGNPQTAGIKPPGPGGNNSGIYITSPDIQSGNTYKYYSSPTINGGTSWHGLYSDATVTTAGTGTNLTVQ